MGIATSHYETYEAEKQGRFAAASKDPYVNAALRIEWPIDEQGPMSYFGGFAVKLANIEESIEMIIGQLSSLHRSSRLSIYVDLGVAFVDTGVAAKLVSSQRITAGVLNGLSVRLLKITGKFAPGVDADMISKWWYNMVALNNFLGLEFEFDASYQIDPLYIDQIGRIPARKTDRALLGGLKQERYPKY